MKLGAFSISLSVKDIAKSRDFYLKLGFEIFGGNIDQNWLILKNDSCVIGLFQGMFEGSILTFNPGWDQEAQALADYTDVREIQRTLKQQGIHPETEADPLSSGPAHIILKDPDGNVIMLDQHV
jgi:catechol 2,3-dioxygenase-like lactoylglutathione lyase family enzyme